MNPFDLSGSTKTLKQRLNEGRIPVQDGLRYAALLADALRAMHDAGHCHGSLTPDSISLNGNRLDLLPAVPGVTRITPYTAPEIAGEHKPADARSDIFSYGAIVFEILTGRKAFEGDTEAALVSSLCAAPAPPSGSPAVDRLLAGCFAKNPAARWPRMQKVQLELKLVMVAARRVNAPAAARPAGAAPVVDETTLQAKLALLEARLTAKLALHEQAVAQSQHAIGDTVATQRRAEMAQLEAALNSKLAAHEQALAETKQAIGEALSAQRGPDAAQLEAALNSKLAAHEQAIAEIQTKVAETAAAQIPGVAQVEEALNAKLAAHEQAIAEIHTKVAAAAAAPPPVDTAQIEAGLNAKLAAHQQSLAEMHNKFTEAVSTLHTAAVAQLEPLLNAKLATHEQALAEMHSKVTEAVAAIPAAGAAADLEPRLDAKLATHEQAVAEMHQKLSDAVSNLHTQVGALSGQFSTVQTQLAVSAEAGPAIGATAARIASELRTGIQENIDHLSRRIAFLEQGEVGTRVSPEEMARIEAELNAVRKELLELHTATAADLHEFEMKLKAQSNAIDSARTAMSQTDDLVERVVEALDSLQASLVEPSEDYLTSIA